MKKINKIERFINRYVKLAYHVEHPLWTAKTASDNWIELKLLTNFRDIESVEMLAKMLKDRVGYPMAPPEQVSQLGTWTQHEDYFIGRIKDDRIKERDGLYILYMFFEVDEPTLTYYQIANRIHRAADTSEGMIREGTMYPLRLKFDPAWKKDWKTEIKGTHTGEYAKLMRDWLIEHEEELQETPEEKMLREHMGKIKGVPEKEMN
jgi:hypothetical protein